MFWLSLELYSMPIGFKVDVNMVPEQNLIVCSYSLCLPDNQNTCMCWPSYELPNNCHNNTIC